MEHYTKIEKEILSKLFNSKRERQKQDIMKFLEDIERLDPSLDLTQPLNILFKGSLVHQPYYQMKFTEICENFSSIDQKLLALLFWNNFGKRMSKSLKEINHITFQPAPAVVLTKTYKCKHCGNTYKKKKSQLKHTKKCVMNDKIPPK